MKQIIFFVFFLICFFSELRGQTIKLESRQLTELIEKSLKENEIPGMQVCIVSKDSILWKRNFGYADVDDKILITDSTMFRIGSVSKIFVGLSIMMLKEQGLLDLNDKMADLIPEVKFYNKWEDKYPVRIVHLLEHTSGFDDIHPAEYSCNAEGWSTLDGLNYHPDTRTCRWEPGKFMSYTNIGPVCAAYVIEKIKGQPYEKFVKEKIFLSLGMRHSSFFNDAYIKKNLAKGYSAYEDEVSYWNVLMRASGSINSNVTELSELVRFFLNKGIVDSISLLSKGSIERIQRAETSLAAKAGYQVGYGLCLKNSKYKGYRNFYHSGLANGYIAHLEYLPELEFGFIVLANTSRSQGLAKLLNDIKNILIPDSKSLPFIDSCKTSNMDKDITGWYALATSRSEFNRIFDIFSGFIKIEKENGKYTFRTLFDGPWILYNYSGNSLYTLMSKTDFTPYIFTEDESGTEFLIVPTMEYNYKKTNSFYIWSLMALLIIGGVLIITSIIELLVIILLRMIKKRKFRNLQARLIPILTIITGIVWYIFAVKIFLPAHITVIGTFTLTSVIFFLLSLFFALFSLCGFIINVVTLKRNMNKLARVHSILIASYCMACTVFLTYCDIIGFMGWRY